MCPHINLVDVKTNKAKLWWRLSRVFNICADKFNLFKKKKTTLVHSVKADLNDFIQHKAYALAKNPNRP